MKYIFIHDAFYGAAVLGDFPTVLGDFRGVFCWLISKS